jgi:hypothetical protein
LDIYSNVGRTNNGGMGNRRDKIYIIWYLLSSIKLDGSKGEEKSRTILGLESG